MDLLSLYYFSELAKDLHITRTANRLFISQQTLSNHIQRLEEYYGVALLYRKPALALTCAGEYVLSFANNINYSNQNLKDILSDIRQEERGVLRFGASTARMNACLPDILPAFSQRYPNVEIRITDTISAKLEPMILDGGLDFAIILSGEQSHQLTYHHLINDQVYLCVADPLLRQYYGVETETLKVQALQGAFLQNFARLPFCLLSNRMGRQIQECFNEAQVVPNTYINSTYTQISTAICFKGLAACFISHASLYNQRSQIPENINIFPLYYCGQPLTQQLSLIRRKERYCSRYAQLFMELLLQHFADMEQVHMEQRV